MPKGICIIENCGNELSERSTLEICPTCRSSLYNWRKRKPAAVIERRKRLRKYDARMSTIVNDDAMEGKSKSTPRQHLKVIRGGKR
jgi:hypothetical protein